MAHPNTIQTSTTWLKDIPSAIALIDKNFEICDASQNWFQKFQLEGKEKETKGVNIFEIFPRFSEDWKVKLDYVLDGLPNIQIMDKVETDGGDSLKYIWHLNPWKDGYGNQLGVILNVQDVKDNHHLQLELQRTRDSLYQKGKMAKIGSWDYSLSEKNVTWSQNIKEILGIDSNLKGTLENMVTFFKEGSSRDTFQTILEMAIRTGKPWDENLELATPGGKSIWVKSIGRPKFKDGKCSRIIGTLQAISQTRETSSAHNQSSASWNYDPFFQQSPVGMAIVDYTTGKLLQINETLEALIGKTNKQLSNKSYRNFLDTKKLGRKNPVTQLSKSGRFGPLDIEYVRGRTKSLNVQLKGKVIEGQNKSKLVLITVVDITKQNEKQLVLEEKIGQTKDEIKKLVNFAHMTSHNLKGQASNFSLLLQFLKTEKMEEERKTIFTMLSHASESLTDTIKGLREIVTIRQNINLRKRPLSFNEYVFKAEQGLSGLIKKEEAKIVNEIPDDLKVRALPVYLESIIGNVLSNAIKFRKKHKKPLVVISAQVKQYYTVVSIEDNGIGLDLKNHEQKLFGLYEAFQKENDSRGMGLYLVKYQMELMKGSVECESKPNEGSVFRLFFSNK
ncbi:PAS domain S-box protein [Flagellimonas sp. 389]|uniref:PAS domain-containing sensor histidine kinase n=1 Tax=Flagellimonas sp. 389 TaxID=2835862 RepID=UPI001BD25B37|nr:ATP-binding protein [Flagellimonas sp. 389]MBS9461434.1 PAS domain S-box protein [Flagellimonas sp. 389]